MITELSILLPTYNHPCLLLVRELQRQAELIPALRYEIIVADDGSTATKVIETNRAINFYKNCKLMECGINRGRSVIRNILAEAASYEWLLFIDSDVTVNKDSFIEKYLQEDSFDVVCGGAELPSGKAIDKCLLRYRYERSCLEYFTAQARAASPYKGFRSNNFLIKRSVMLAHPFCTGIRSYGYEDVLLGKELCDSKASLTHIDNPVCIADLEPNDLFLRKTEEGCRTLWSMRLELEGYSRLLKVAMKVRRYGLSGTAKAFFNLFRTPLRNNLTGKNPSVFLYNIYRIGYLISLRGEIYDSLSSDKDRI